MSPPRPISSSTLICSDQFYGMESVSWPDPSADVCEAPTPATFCGPAIRAELYAGIPRSLRRMESFWAPQSPDLEAASVSSIAATPFLSGSGILEFLGNPWVLGTLSLIFFATQVPGDSSTYPIVEPFTRIDPVIELDGNPEVGTVVILRNIHGDMFNDYETLDSRTIRNVVAYQVQLFGEIERGAFPFIAMEGVTVRDLPILTSPELAASVQETLLPELRSLVTQALLPRLSGETEERIYQLGAGLLYSLAHRSEVELIPAERVGYGDTIRAACARLGESACRTVVYEARESYAADRIMEILEEHPGATVALLYGAAHEFADDFQRNAEARGLRPPRVVTLRWTNRWSEELFSALNATPNPPFRPTSGNRRGP